jgi:hypothetical protein
MNIGMEVIIENRPGWNIYDIWFCHQSRYDGKMIIYNFDKKGQWEQSAIIKEWDKLPDPSITLDWRTLENLIKAAKGSFPPSEQMHDHLQDAIKIRDRLLAIVEKKP